ncbi:hypothetical protein [Streptomyces sp. NRRL F-5135]|uniref:hypothetical protein n=1 Tax=Streptomyces sp. NRRL F-5135 TaxID=1463858 RepID=UPI0004CC6B9A|nr:hypothetical protein [Streptomyces sp. NRRL F-5135]
MTPRRVLPVVVLALMLTGCGGGSDSSDAKPKTAATASEPAAEESPTEMPTDCSNEDLSQAEWMESCSGTEGSKGGSSQPTTAGPLELGTPVPTTGDGGTGVLEMTPTTVVYSKDGAGNDPDKDVFAVVTVKQRPTTAAPAAEVPPMSGGGWSWIAPDGQSIDEGNGQSFNVVMDDFGAAGPVQPGSFVWDAAVFDLTAAQAKGGTLVYVDSEETAFRWKIPAADSGPQVAEVKEQLKF